MFDETKAVADRMRDGLANGNVPGDIIADEIITWHNNDEVERTMPGGDAFAAIMNAEAAVYQELMPDLERDSNMYVAEDVIVQTSSSRGSYKGTPYHQATCLLLHVRDGKIWRLQSYHDHPTDRGEMMRDMMELLQRHLGRPISTVAGDRDT